MPALLAAVLILGVAIAWQVHERYLAPPAPTAQPRLPRDYRLEPPSQPSLPSPEGFIDEEPQPQTAEPQDGRPQSRPSGAASQAAGSLAPAMIEQALSGTGLSPLAGEPGGIAPPAGARRLTAVGRQAGGVREELGRYELEGELPLCQKHYRDLLNSRGFKLTGEPQETGLSRMIFFRDSTQVVVSLRKASADGKTVEITVVCQRPISD